MLIIVITTLPSYFILSIWLFQRDNICFIIFPAWLSFFSLFHVGATERCCFLNAIQTKDAVIRWLVAKCSKQLSSENVLLVMLPVSFSTRDGIDSFLQFQKNHKIHELCYDHDDDPFFDVQTTRGGNIKMIVITKLGPSHVKRLRLVTLRCHMHYLSTGGLSAPPPDF